MFKKQGKLHVSWWGPPGAAFGYAESNSALLKSLAGTKVVCHANPDDCEVGIAYAPAHLGEPELMPSPYRIAYTMFEADLWPDQWVSACNCCNQVWVPSRFCADGLRRSGCDRPIEIVPLGASPEYTFGPKPKASVFTIGYVGAADYRKGFDLFVQAISEEFGPDDQVRFVIHSTNLTETNVPKNPWIDISTKPKTNEEMADLYRSLDLLVLPTRGEGFGLTALEAMACGTCVAVTHWSSPVDFLGDHSLGIAIDSLVSARGYHGSRGQWARPSMKSIRYCLRWAYDHRAETRQMGECSAEWVADRWTYRHTADRIAKLLARVDPNERIECDTVEMVRWTGNPMTVTNRAGCFVRNIPVELPVEKVALIDFGDGRFIKERRFRRLDAQ